MIQARSRLKKHNSFLPALKASVMPKQLFLLELNLEAKKFRKRGWSNGK